MATPYEFPCPVCDATPGQRCNAAKGDGVRMDTWTHRERPAVLRTNMHKFAAGDWIFSTFNTATEELGPMWRVMRYEENTGTITAHDGQIIKGTFWSLFRWKDDGIKTVVHPKEWDDWEFQCDLMRTRQEAIDEALERAKVRVRSSLGE